MPTEKLPPFQDSIEPLVYTVRDQRVLLDADLARIYGASTKRFNEAFKRNRQRFPADFAFQLTPNEFLTLRAQIPTLAKQTHDPTGESRNWSQFATSSSRRRGVTYRPWAFTEHGALMVANTLRSKQALQMSVFVIRAFVRMREQLAANATILKRLVEIDETLLRHDTALRDLYQKLLPLLQPPPEPPRRRIGFHIGDD